MANTMTTKCYLVIFILFCIVYCFATYCRFLYSQAARERKKSEKETKKRKKTEKPSKNKTKEKKAPKAGGDDGR